MKLSVTVVRNILVVPYIAPHMNDSFKNFNLKTILIFLFQFDTKLEFRIDKHNNKQIQIF